MLGTSFKRLLGRSAASKHKDLSLQLRLHLNSLAMEMQLDKKLPRITYFNKPALKKNYKEKREVFKMLASMAAMRFYKYVSVS